MKKALTHIFVVAVNFYLLAFFIGLILMFLTIFSGPLNVWASIAIVLTSLLACIIYQITRIKWSILTIGEMIINNKDKENILHQRKQFSITRTPLFLLVFVTLLINGNLQDGLSEGSVYSFGSIITYVLFFLCVYFGLKYFFIKPEVLTIIVLSIGLFFIGFIFNNSPKGVQTGDSMFIIYSILAALWLIAGLIYKSKRIDEITHEAVND
jgi:hypothetical protein